MNIIRERLKFLRELMSRENMDAYIVYSSDPHGSEYVADHWRCRSWISGFTGSAGTVVITREEAGLWTDFRYFIQAEEELKDSGITLHRSGTPGVEEYREWICRKLLPGSVIGMDGRTLTVKEWESLAQKFIPLQYRIANRKDLVGELWRDRPSLPAAPVWQLGLEEAGELCGEKLARVRREMDERGVTSYLISSLDDIAWLLNVRGGDVPYNPVVQSFLLLEQEEAFWYVDEAKLEKDVRVALEADNIQIKPYEAVADDLSGLPDDSVLLLSPARTNSLLATAPPESLKILQSQDITTAFKACKNETEQKQIRIAMEKDGAALVRFFIWLEGAIEERAITELEAAAVLRECRSRQDDFLDESFSPIPGYRAHGAICHYEADEKGQFTMDSSGLFLLDSGGQYRQGTTDITRTVTLGSPSEDEIKDYTLVLKGHIALSRARFPRGTRGYQLDLLARQPLWDEGLNYGHGTGHGVGFVLNVHEGPQRISPHAIDEPLMPGMVTSNEPGIYREGKYGIRIENLILTVPWEDCPGEEEFYRFETLSLCPYDRELIDVSLLSESEIGWINAYHAEVVRRLSPRLSAEERKWLERAACEIS